MEVKENKMEEKMTGRCYENDAARYFTEILAVRSVSTENLVHFLIKETSTVTLQQVFE
jgi:hypothetical protein